MHEKSTGKPFKSRTSNTFENKAFEDISDPLKNFVPLKHFKRLQRWQEQYDTSRSRPVTDILTTTHFRKLHRRVPHFIFTIIYNLLPILPSRAFTLDEGFAWRTGVNVFHLSCK